MTAPRRRWRAWERRCWDLQRVLEHLSGYAVKRRVNRSGSVSLYRRNHYVGVIHQGREVYVMLDPESREWVFAEERGQYLRRQAADYLTPERIVGLTVTRRTPSDVAEGRGKTSCR